MGKSKNKNSVHKAVVPIYIIVLTATRVSVLVAQEKKGERAED